MRFHSNQYAPPVLALIAVLLCAASLAAQEEADTWRTQLELGLNGASGNSSFSVLRTGGSVKYLLTDVAEFELSTLFRYGKNESKVISNDLRGSAKFDWHPQSDFSPFLYVAARRDPIRRIDAKIDGGLGAKWTFLRRTKTKISLSTAGILDYENFRLDAGSTDAESEGVFRVSVRLKFDHEFGSGATFGHVTFWQPEAANFGDYNIEMTTSVSTKLLSKLALALEHEYLHDEVPPTGVKPNDQKFSAVLRVIL